MKNELRLEHCNKTLPFLNSCIHVRYNILRKKIFPFARLNYTFNMSKLTKLGSEDLHMNNEQRYSSHFCLDFPVYMH